MVFYLPPELKDIQMMVFQPIDIFIYAICVPAIALFIKVLQVREDFDKALRANDVIRRAR
jgi:hypothetical protein